MSDKKQDSFITAPGNKTWVVKITVNPKWIEDGFELTEDKLIAVMENMLPFVPNVTPDEFTVEIIS